MKPHCGLADFRFSIFDFRLKRRLSFNRQSSIVNRQWKTGQTVIEYLVVTAAVVAALVAVRGVVQTRTHQVLQEAVKNIPIK